VNGYFNKSAKKLAPGENNMYRKANPNQQKFEDFYLPFSGKLRSDNRWVILSKQIPWDQIEQEYSANFSESIAGCPAKPARVALGALIIKERLGTTDRETTLQIAENPYLQYFLGFLEYKDEPRFDHSLMTHFRKRFDKGTLARINALIVNRALEQTNDLPVKSPVPNEQGQPDADKNKPSNKGKLIVDATCTPADVAYPTDLNLLNEAREKTEAMIDAMHAPQIGQSKKPRTYRRKARKDYLTVAKRKKPSYKKVRKAIGKQLRYLKRNLGHIETMVSAGLLIHLSQRQYRNLLVIKELYRQQQLMYDSRSHKAADRIVSISQPHLRPIVRGKAKSDVEFGAKISVSLVDGFSFVDRISWDNYNESGDLIDQIESYRKRFGFYPESVHADKIYRTRDNRRWCRARGIRLSGPPLGRPKKATESNAEQFKQEKRQNRQDEIYRNAIEGKFGQGKRRFSLSRVMAKLAGTAEVAIMVSFIVMNLEKILSAFLYFLLYIWQWLQIAGQESYVYAQNLRWLQKFRMAD
jgi:IS5 family transposase